MRFSEQASVCDRLRDTIKLHRYKIGEVIEDEEKCLIDFRHPKIKVGEPVSYFASSVYYNKRTEHLNTTVRSKFERFREFYFDYCCEYEGGECLMQCRPHLNPDEEIFSVEATFMQTPLAKFDRLLEEMR